ncbi:TonB family protein [Mucilaginibacter terrae]|uniref:TonB family protein n=1 Tax=Mucilaginibacter terrae TaxID=1955052 RepID=UPI00364015BC
MSTNKNDILQIRKYLNGELDAHAMHELERQALDDPFLMDALEGYGQAGRNQQPHLNELQNRLQQRVTPAKKRLTLWPVMGIAASVVLFLSVGGWWLLNYRAPANKPDGMPADKTEVVVRPLVTDTNKLQPQINDVTVRQSGTPVAKSKPSADWANLNRAKTQALSEDRSVAPAFNNNEPVANAPALPLVQPGRVNDSLALANTFGKAEKQIRIRGARSITADSKPLYVVDGKIFNGELKDLKAADIENLSVIKDASAAAIYGSRGANGVIVVTTKKGKTGNKIIDSNLMAGNKLNEVVVVGYGTQLKKDITGSVTSVKPASIDQALQGRLAGVSVTSESKTPLKTVTGQVLSQSDGKPLPGVSIMIAGKYRGTQTDANGKFNIAATDKDELDIQYIGYLGKRLKVKGNDSLKVALENNNQSLSEVVIVSKAKAIKQIKEAHPQNGWAAFQKYLNMKADSTGEKGLVRVSFVVNPDGSLNNFKVLKSLKTDMDEEAINIIKNGPKWVPNVNGQPETVKVKITFKE